MKRFPGPAVILLLLGIVAYILLVLITIYHKQPPLYDEPLFIPNVYLFEQYGLSKEFLLRINEQAPGPLYQFIHYPLRSITHLQTPGIRLVNTALLGLMIVLLTFIINYLQKLDKKQAFLLALNMMSIPMVWNVSGMALTEIPPMFFATLSILFLLLALRKQDSALLLSLSLALLAGAATGLSILGRSPFLIMVPAAGALLVGRFDDRRRWAILGIYMATALAICLPVFIIWKGLMPPQQAFTAAGGLSIQHAMLALAYGALVTFILAPEWFYFNRRILFFMLAVYAVLLIANFTVIRLKYAPLYFSLAKVLPIQFMRLYPYIIVPVLWVIAFYFSICSVIRVWERRTEPFFLFLFLCTMLMLATNLKVMHLFSSRYVAQAAPFFVLLLLSYDRISYNKCLRTVAGMVIGFLSLETYFHFH
jgi:4-amino-4-deoxy-L-arabinose transferase-like glycosyltransferase